MKRLTFTCLFILGVTGAGFSQSGGVFTMTRSNVGGGATIMSGGVFAATVSTSRSLDGAPATGGTFSVTTVPREPVSVPVSVAGRILTPDGKAVIHATVTINGPNGIQQIVFSGPKGDYSFADVPTGHLYTVSVDSKRFAFIPIVIALTEALAGLDIMGEPR